jgi:hypothetical protein
MLTLTEATQAFGKAIENVGLEKFKKTSIFMSNNRQTSELVEVKAA